VVAGVLVLGVLVLGVVVLGVVVLGVDPDCDVVLSSTVVDGDAEVVDAAGSDVGDPVAVVSGSSVAGSAVHAPRARHTTTAADAVRPPGVRRLMC